MRRACAWLVIAVVVVGCGDASSPEADDPTSEVEAAGYGESCGAAVERAADVGEYSDAVDDLDPAIAECADLGELRAATTAYPEALDGANLEMFVGNRCQYAEDDAVTGSGICAELNG